MNQNGIQCIDRGYDTLANQIEIEKWCKIYCAEGFKEKTPKKENKLQKSLERELEALKNVTGVLPLIKHKTELKNHRTNQTAKLTMKQAMKEVIDKEAAKMLAEGIIESSKSPWSSPVLIVKKKNDNPRFCIDYRRHTKVCERDAYPLLQINSTLDQLKAAAYFLTIDLKNGYWQVEVTEDSKPLTTYTVIGRGLMQFPVLPYGLHFILSTF